MAYGMLAGAVVLYAGLNYLPLAVFLHGRRTGIAIRAVILLALVGLALVEIRWGYGVYDAVRRALT